MIAFRMHVMVFLWILQMNALLLGVRDEVREYREKFQFVFRP